MQQASDHPLSTIAHQDTAFGYETAWTACRVRACSLKNILAGGLWEMGEAQSIKSITFRTFLLL